MASRPAQVRRSAALFVATLIALALALAGTVTPAPAQAAARAAAPTPQYAVSIKGEKITFGGAIGTRKRTVYLQRKSGSAWKTIAKSRSNPAGGYAVRVTNTVRVGKSARYRVYVKTSRKRLYSASTRVTSVRGTLSFTITRVGSFGTGVDAVMTLSPARPGTLLTLAIQTRSGLQQGTPGVQDANGSVAVTKGLFAGTNKLVAFYGKSFSKPIVRSASQTVVTTR